MSIFPRGGSADADRRACRRPPGDAPHGDRPTRRGTGNRTGSTTDADQPPGDRTDRPEQTDPDGQKRPPELPGIWKRYGADLPAGELKSQQPGDGERTGNRRSGNRRSGPDRQERPPRPDRVFLGVPGNDTRRAWKRRKSPEVSGNSTVKRL